MNWIDVGILVIVALFTLLSLSSGFIREITNLVGFVLAIVLAGRFYPLIAQQMTFLGPAQEVAGSVFGFMAIFVIVAIAASFLGSVLASTFGLLLGPFDGLAGAVFGAVKGLLFAQILVVLLLRFPIVDLAQPLSESFIGRFLAAQAPLVLALLPSDFDSVRRAIMP